MEISLTRKNEPIARSPHLFTRVSLGGDEAIFKKDRHATAEANTLVVKRSLAMVTSQILAFPLLLLVVIYQKTISPDHGFTQVLYPHGYCQFYPSCSQFAKLTLEQRGIWGLPQIISRLIKCR